VALKAAVSFDSCAIIYPRHKAAVYNRLFDLTQPEFDLTARTLSLEQILRAFDNLPDKADGLRNQPAQQVLE
jgi:hypothetical protein